MLQPRSLSNDRGRNLSLASWSYARSKGLWLVTGRGAFTALFLATAACIAVPNVGQSIADANITTTSKPRIVGADGPLTAGQSQALVISIADAIVLGTDTAGDLEDRFEEDRAVAKEIKLEIWRERTLTDRVGDFIQRTGQSLL